MTFSRQVTSVCALLAFLAAGPTSAATSGSIDRAFASAVAKILAGVRNDFLDSLSAAEKRAFVACAQRIMNGAPLARKQYVLAARSAGEMRQRFDEVALDNRARLKQQISSECS